MHATLTAAAFILAVLLILISFSSGKHPPVVPDDAFHALARNNAACRTCHTPGTQAPLKKKHPPKEECLTCHRK